MQQRKSKILFVGGGTGGHFYPLISIAEALNARPEQPRLYYAGPDAYDSEALRAENISFVWIPAGKQRRYASIQNFFDVFKSAFGLGIAVLKLFFIYPDVIMSKGGYTSVPIVLAAAFLRIPIVIHESDAVPGKANKLAARYARDIIVAYDEAHAAFNRPNTYLFGIPIRNVLLQNPTQNAIASLGIDPDRPVILILGGSQGAERVNALVLDSLDELLTNFTIIHQTGKQNLELCTLSADKLIPDTGLRKHYHPVAFLNATMLNDAYHIAHIVISRAGSNSIYEIALHKKPSIIIPIPESISHDQRTNAYAYARRGGAVVMEEGNLTDGLLRSEIERIMQNEDVYAAMSQAAESFGKRDTADRVAALLIGISQEH